MVTLQDDLHNPSDQENLSIFDIANGISWTVDGLFYLNLKHNKYELLIDYLNASDIESLTSDIVRFKDLQVLQNTKSKEKIEEYIMVELDGFNDLDNGYSAHIAGSHDLSASIQYNIESDSISIIHPNLPSLEKFIITSDDLIRLSSQMIQILLIKRKLKFGEN